MASPTGTAKASDASDALTPGRSDGLEGRLAPLVDRQHRAVSYLRVSVTDRCNYRCTYCLPEDGIQHVERQDILRFEEIAALVACFVDLGVRRVRLTGGEPTVRRSEERRVGNEGAWRLARRRC